MPYANPREVIREVLKLFKPPPNIHADVWAEKYRKLSAKNCALPGDYRLKYTPYIQEPLRCVSDREVERIVMMKASQVAWTDGVLNNALAYQMSLDPGPTIIMFPTEDMARRYSRGKLTPMLEDTPALRGLVAAPKSRDSTNTILSKEFFGGHLELIGSNAPSKLASDPIRYIFVEEPDRCALDSGGEGDSLTLLYERSKFFDNRKIIVGGSPTHAGESQIEREYSLSDQRQFYVPCQNCGDAWVFEWNHVNWDEDKSINHPVFGHYLPKTATVDCPECGFRHTNEQKKRQLMDGAWIAQKPFDGTAGFWISEIYSPAPKGTLRHVVEKYLTANQSLKQGDHRLMITFHNQSLGKTWEMEGERVSGNTIYQTKRHDYGPDVPEKALIITAGIDVQKRGFEIDVVAWSEEYESWQLDYHVLEGDPHKIGVWNDLDDCLRKVYMHASGAQMRIVASCIDSGGHHTDEVYKFAKARFNRRVWAIKGKGGVGLSIKHSSSRKNAQNCLLWTLGVDTLKTLVHDRLRIEEHGPGFTHIQMGRDQAYCEGFEAERPVPKYVNGHKQYVWVKDPGRPNEPLDTRGYATAALEILNPVWPRIADNMAPKKDEDDGKNDVDDGSIEIDPRETPVIAARRAQKRITSRGRGAGGYVKRFRR